MTLTRTASMPETSSLLHQEQFGEVDEQRMLQQDATPHRGYNGGDIAIVSVNEEVIITKEDKTKEEADETDKTAPESDEPEETNEEQEEKPKEEETKEEEEDDDDASGLYLFDDDREDEEEKMRSSTTTEQQKEKDNSDNQDRSPPSPAAAAEATTTRVTTRRRRSSSILRRGSAYGDDGIPLDFERKQFNRVLPKPTHLLLNAADNKKASSDRGTAIYTRSSSSSVRGGLRRVSSEPVFVRPVYRDDGNNKVEEEEETKEERRISFGTIQFREHSQTIGDNPSCSYGTPIQLDWEYVEMEEVGIDDYEIFALQNRRRDHNQFRLNYYQRLHRLRHMGFSDVAIKDTKKLTKKSQFQREWTKYKILNIPMIMTLEDAIESGARKIKRSVLGNRSGGIRSGF